MSARTAERARRDVVRASARVAWACVVACAIVGCRHGDPKPLAPPGAPPRKANGNEEVAIAALPFAARLAFEANQKRKSEKWKNERPMTLRLVPRGSVDGAGEGGSLDAATCADLCRAEKAECWSVDAFAPPHTPKKRRPAVDCTDGHSVSISEDDFAALEPRADATRALPDAVCRERCGSDGCFLAGFTPTEIVPVHEDEALVLCGPTKIIGEEAAKAAKASREAGASSEAATRAP
jgi:hypothetical protein